MYKTVVQESFGAKGFNWEAINVEMAGIDFDKAVSEPPEAETARTIRLVSRLMDHYQIAFAHIAGHFERDARGDKPDPGVVFMGKFREQLAAYRASLSPLKRQHLAGRGDS
ncbi:MAG: N-acetylmuramoyl-L-alanine amidase [Anaerolineales bacterium]